MLGVELELEVEGAIVFVDGVKVDAAGTVIAGTRSLRSSLGAMPTVRCPKGGGPDTAYSDRSTFGGNLKSLGPLLAADGIECAEGTEW